MTDPRYPASGQQPAVLPQRPQPVTPHAPHVVPHAPQPHPGRPSVAPMPMQKAPPTAAELEPLSLVEEEVEQIPNQPVVKPKIKAFGAESLRKEHTWKRQTYKDGKGAVRVKTFHGKYSDQGMEHLDDVINEWLDEHPEVEVKFVTSTVNIFEGKIREPALVLNMWY